MTEYNVETLKASTTRLMKIRAEIRDWQDAFEDVGDARSPWEALNLAAGYIDDAIIMIRELI